MKYDLVAILRRTRNPRRRSIVVRDIVPPATLATNLYLAAYKPIVELWARHAETVIEEYGRTLAMLIGDAASGGADDIPPRKITPSPVAHLSDSPADLQARLDAAASEAERVFILLDAALRDWGIQVERWQRGKWRGAVLTATGIDLQTLIGPEDVRQTVEQIIAWNASLVRDVSAQARQRIGNAVFAGLNQRKPATEVAKEIREAVGMARDRSVRIASDQLSKLTSALAAERRREAGLSVYKFRHSGKLHPRSWHRARNGKLYAESEADAGRVINGDVVNPPLPDDDRAGIPPFCGCREQAVIDLS